MILDPDMKTGLNRHGMIHSRSVCRSMPGVDE